MMNRNALFAGGIRPHLYCLPVLKTEPDREALLEALASGDPRFFPRHRQRAACAAYQGGSLRLRGNLLSAMPRIELYAEVFDGVGALPLLQAFASRIRGRLLWPAAEPGLDHPRQAEPWDVPAHYPFGSGEICAAAGGREDCLAHGGCGRTHERSRVDGATPRGCARS